MWSPRNRHLKIKFHVEKVLLYFVIDYAKSAQKMHKKRQLLQTGPLIFQMITLARTFGMSYIKNYTKIMYTVGKCYLILSTARIWVPDFD